MKRLAVGIQKIDENNIAEALSLFTNVSIDSKKILSTAILGKNEFTIIKHFAYILQSAVLFYYTKAIEKQKVNDNFCYHTYLSYSSGIYVILNTSIMPVIKKNAVQFDSQIEIEILERIQSEIEHNITDKILQAASSLEEDAKKLLIDRIDSSIEIMQVHPVCAVLMMNLLGNIGYTIFAVPDEKGLYEIGQWTLAPVVNVAGKFESRQELMSYCFRQTAVHAAKNLDAEVVKSLGQVFNLEKLAKLMVK